MEIFPTDVDDAVRRHFTILEWKVHYGVLTYTVGDEDTKQRFLRLYYELSPKGFIPVLRREGDKKVLRIFKKPPERKHRLMWNIVLLLATIVTVSIAGYLFTNSEVYSLIDPTFASYRVFHHLAYIAAIFFVLGIHELGHKIACLKHGLKSTPPYFIPGPPEIGGSLGAVMMQETPILNRDQLFDLGLLGPLMGFIASILITLLGLSLSYLVPYDLVVMWMKQGRVSALPTEPLLFGLMREGILSALRIPQDQVVIIHPIAFAGWVGMLITFLNTLPVGQLDGGHVVRAIFSSKKHLIISLVAIAIMLITGFIVMAIVALIIFFRGHPGPLDDVSPPSTSRKALLILLPLMCGLCFTSITFTVL